MKTIVLYLILCVLSFSHTYDELRKNIFSGGVKRDGIPSIDSPKYIDTAAAEAFMEEGDIVFLWEGKEVTIIPQKILVWHEIINETSSGTNTSITYCPLTATVIGFYTDTTLGVSGRLLNSNLVIYDRKRELLWPQILGTSVSQEAQGEALKSFPLYWSTWKAASEKYPSARVLSKDTGRIRNYNRDPYGSYDDVKSYYHRGGAFFPLMASSSALPPKTMVRGLLGRKSAAAVTWERVIEEEVINIDHGDIEAVIIYDRELKTVRAFSRKFQGETLEFYIEEGKIRDRKLKRVWNERGRSGSYTLEPYKGMDAFWFAWYAFYPETELIGDQL